MTIHSSQQSGILTLTFDRPDKLNALNLEMYQQLNQQLQQAATDPQIHVLVFKGEGASFTAGNDLADFLAHGELDQHHPAVQFLYQVVRFPKPIIADVHGHAIGIGTTLLLHCDLVVADPLTRFQLPFIQLALVPEFASSALLPKIIGPQRAAELLMLGEPFSAEQAYQWGLINQVAEHEEREGMVQEWASKLTKLPQQALRHTKALLKVDCADVEQTIAAELKLFAQSLNQPECQQRLKRALDQ